MQSRGLAIAPLAYNTTVWASPYGIPKRDIYIYTYIYTYIHIYKHTISTQYSAITCLALRRSAIISWVEWAEHILACSDAHMASLGHRKGYVSQNPASIPPIFVGNMAAIDVHAVGSVVSGLFLQPYCNARLLQYTVVERNIRVCRKPRLLFRTSLKGIFSPNSAMYVLSTISVSGYQELAMYGERR